MKYFIIPLILLLFVMIYPHAEWNYDCPSAITDPKGNDSCTYGKSIAYELMSVLSLTEFGFPSDKVFYEQTMNPDAYESSSIVLLVVATIIVALVERRQNRRNQPKYSKETAEELR